MPSPWDVFKSGVKVLWEVNKYINKELLGDPKFEPRKDIPSDNSKINPGPKPTDKGGSGDDFVNLDLSSKPLLAVSGGSGTDTLALKGTSPGQVVINLSKTDQVLSVNGVQDAAVQSGFENVRAFDLQGAKVNITGDGKNNIIYGTYLSGDILKGGKGDDLIFSWQGADRLSGNAGADTFVFFKGFSSGSAISDFRANGDADRIGFSNYGSSYGSSPKINFSNGILTIKAEDGTIDTFSLPGVAKLTSSDYFFTS